MKNLYTFLFILVFCGVISSARAQKPVYLGKINDVAATYKSKVKTALSNTTARKVQVSHTLPGKQPLMLQVNSSKREGTAEFFYGEVYNTKSSNFYLKITDGEVSGSIIMLQQKKFYRYSSTPDGSVYLTEEDIDKVLCVGSPKAQKSAAEKKQKPVSKQNNATATVGAGVPILESLPGAGAVIYLDFDGQTVTNTYWNSNFNSGNPIVAAPADLSEKEMTEVWKMMSEDYRPFALNVTTNETVFNNAPIDRRMRVIFTPTDSFYPNVGGVAYLTSFTWGTSRGAEHPCWVFNRGIKGAGECGSHEAGHTLGLDHDGRTSPAEEYFEGQDSWAPIMGASYYTSVTQWSKGEYPSANNQEDDVNKIATLNGFGYRADDHGNDITTATPLIQDAGGNVSGIVNKGIITTQTDLDFFSFNHSGGPVGFTVNPDPNYPNLDIYLSLRNAAGAVVTTVNPNTMAATLDTTLGAGTYYLEVDGITGSMGANSDYASLGSYSIASKDYDIPLYSFGCTQDDYINNFSFNTLVNNNTACNEGTATGYTVYDPTGSLTTSVNKGQSYTIKMQSGEFYAEYFGVWIDYNQDKDFDDAGEFVYASSSATINLLTANITIPATATLGATRLRVRCSYDEPIASTESSTLRYYGEAEDYTITIATPVNYWNARFGGSSTESLPQVIRTSDGGYLLGGSSNSGVTGDKTQAGRGGYDFWVVKTDASGNKQWDKRFGGSLDDHLYDIIQTSDGGYLLGGSSASGVSGDKTQNSRGGTDYWLVKINNNGSKLWDKRFGGSGNDELISLGEASARTGNLYLAGHSTSGQGGDKSETSRGGKDYWMLKLNSSGSKLWDKRFGGSSDEELRSIIITADGGYLLGGKSLSGVSGDKTQSSRGSYDYWLVKTNSTGGKLWDKRFGGSGNDELFSLGETSPNTGNLYVAGYSTSGQGGDKSEASQGGKDYWMLKLNSSGSKLWDKRFGGSSDEELRSIIITADGGYLLGGKSLSGVSGDKTQGSRGNYDYWIVKTNSTGGKLWDKRFGGNSEDQLQTVLQTSDGGYLLAGQTASGKGGDINQPSRGGTDFWLVKVAPSSGAAVPEALVEPVAIASASEEPAASIAVKTEQAVPAFKLIAAPNPVTDRLKISFNLPETQPVHLQVYDNQGQVVKNLFNGEAQANKLYELEWLPEATQPAGLYILRFRSGDETKQQKIIYRK